LAVFAVATLALATYGLHLYVLLILFRRQARRRRQEQRETIETYRRTQPDADWPVVTCQIPVYNELDVAQRVIEAVAAMDYPPGKLDIQVLDDSTDSTCELVDRTRHTLRARGADIKVLRRPSREGYKAGALANGVRVARGASVAVFDADFVPPADFLRKAVPLLEAAPDLACMQGRWGHLNRNESWLTEAQALGIDGHFAIEQGARAWNGLMMNFNGTAGVWRKAAITDPEVGGWSGDTLTEDLDLSYRAQLSGWRLGYCLDMPCPAELPGTVSDLKSQQRRWATGSIQVACKLLPRIWRARISLGQKIEATLHLTHYSVAVWMLLLALAARPMLLVFDDGRVFSHEWFWLAWCVILLSAFAPSMTYAYARYSLEGNWSGLKTIPTMLMLGCGLCINNSLAVFRGLVTRGGEFVRTPKSGSAESDAKPSSYRLARNHMWIAEIALGVYSLVSFFVYFRGSHRVFSFFLLIYAIGFCVIGWLSRPRRHRKKRTGFEVPSLFGAKVEPVESPTSLLKKGTGSGLMADHATEKRPQRGACPLFQQAPTGGR
jgi:cellulose synthase/poly-beta-1,6-N-acetylglucosamine synthase-like glycosyltransferase